MTDLTSSFAASHAGYQKLFTEMDFNCDGTVKRDAFVECAPDGVDAQTACGLFDMTDSEGKGELGDKELADSFTQYSATVQAALLKLQQADGGDESTAELFAQLDSNADGKLSQDELSSANSKPPETSDKSDNSGGGNITAGFDAAAAELKSLAEKFSAALGAADAPASAADGPTLDQFVRAIDAYGRAASG